MGAPRCVSAVRKFHTEKTLMVFITLITLINCGAMLEQQRWIYYLEIARLLLTFTFISVEVGSVALFGISVIGILAIAPNQSIQRGYLALLYKTRLQPVKAGSVAGSS